MNWSNKKQKMKESIEIMLEETKKFRDTYDIVSLLQNKELTDESVPENPILIFSSKLRELNITANDIFRYCDEEYGNKVFGDNMERIHVSNWRSMY